MDIHMHFQSVRLPDAHAINFLQFKSLSVSDAQLDSSRSEPITQEMIDDLKDTLSIEKVKLTAARGGKF